MIQGLKFNRRNVTTVKVMNMTKLILSVYLSAKLWFSAQSTFTLSLNQAKKFILEYQRLLPSKSLLMQLFMDLLDTWLKTTVISSRSLYVLSIMMLTINSMLKVSFQTEHGSSDKAWKWHCCLHRQFLGVPDKYNHYMLSRRAQSYFAFALLSEQSKY